MSALIFKWDGTIDKYVGDEVVAIWNSPVAQPNHALLAVRCAYDLIHEAPSLLAKLASKGLPPIGWGIGINTGPAVGGKMGRQGRFANHPPGGKGKNSAGLVRGGEPFHPSLAHATC